VSVVASNGELHPPWERRASREGRRCRCGTRLTSHDVEIVYGAPPANVRGLLHDFPFCSIACARTYLLEGIEFLDAFSDAKSRATCSDLREVMASLTEAVHSL
jgi:hypothetical protein